MRGRRSKNFITEREQKQSLLVEGWGVSELYYWEGAKKTFTAGGRGVRRSRSDNFITEGAKKKIHCRWEGGWGEGGVKTLLLRESKKSLPVGGGKVEKGETLLPGGSTKIHCRCEWGWVCGRKCEDFVTGRWPRSRNIKSESTIHPPEKKSSKAQGTSYHQEVRVERPEHKKINK